MKLIGAIFVGILIGGLAIYFGIDYINPKPIPFDNSRQYDSLLNANDSLNSVIQFTLLEKQSLQLILESKDVKIKELKLKIKTNEEIRIAASALSTTAKVDSLSKRFGLR